VQLSRSSGILLHPTSLPGGRLGEAAYRFVDWLQAAGQSWWQVLPLGPPDDAGSPYRSHSAFAGWRGLLAEPHAPVTAEELDRLAAREGGWLGDWARYAGDGALADQVRFEREWRALREYAAARGIGLIGDVPIYVARESADFAARPELFEEGEVAGVPPDALGPDGQLWGNPLYDWELHRRQGYRWWIERLRRTFELVDLARVDHFRGFVSYWAVPVGAPSARGGRWRRGPGAELFRAVAGALGELPLIAENLGVITPAVERLRHELRLPGMHVVQYAFEGGRSNPHRPENHEENGVVYTGTHDTDTARGWWDSLEERARGRTGLDPAEPHWSLIELALSSRAALAIVPLQDVLGLGSGARMNRPGTAEGNWRWRFEAEALTPALAARLRAATECAGRSAGIVLP
jgi:4-alpha-glucanotransferase